MMKTKTSPLLKRKNRLFNLFALGIFTLFFSSTAEAKQVRSSHLGTFEGSTTFTVTSESEVKPGLWLEVMNSKGEVTEYESEVGILTIPNTKEGAYITQAKLVGQTKYKDIQTGELLDQWEDGRELTLVSVKNPTLKITGNNLFNPEDYDGLTAQEGYWTANRVHSTTTPVRLQLVPHQSYTFSFKKSTTPLSWIGVVINGVYINNGNADYKRTFTVDETGVASIQIGANVAADIGHGIKDLMLSEGTQATPYTPYQSSVLTFSEDIDLRGIGEVRDTLDLMTGAWTQQVSEIYVDGTNALDYYIDHIHLTDHSRIRVRYNELNVKKETKNFACDHLTPYATDWREEAEGLQADNSSHELRPYFLWIRVANMKLEGTTKDDLKKWLTENPLTVQYERATPNIRTINFSATHSFSPVGIQPLTVSGTVQPTVISLQVPTEPLTFVLNPNDPTGQFFVAPTLTLTNETLAPIQVDLKTFEQVTDLFNDVAPTQHESWLHLTKTESKDIALALTPLPSEGWLSVNDQPHYVINSNNTSIGVVKGKHDVQLTFEAKHGLAFNHLYQPQYRLTFIFELKD